MLLIINLSFIELCAGQFQFASFFSLFTFTLFLLTLLLIFCFTYFLFIIFPFSDSYLLSLELFICLTMLEINKQTTTKKYMYVLLSIQSLQYSPVCEQFDTEEKIRVGLVFRKRKMKTFSQSNKAACLGFPSLQLVHVGNTVVLFLLQCTNFDNTHGSLFSMSGRIIFLVLHKQFSLKQLKCANPVR